MTRDDPTRRRDGVMPVHPRNFAAVEIRGEWFVWISDETRRVLLGLPNEDRKAIDGGRG